MKNTLFYFILAAMMLSILSGCDIIADAVTKTHDNEHITIATVWGDDHIIKGTLTVNAQLTIKACSTIKMEAGARIDVRDDGSLIVIGKPDCKTKFTSAKTIPSPGDWEGIWIYDTASAGNAFELVTFEYGGGDYGVLWVDNGADVRIDASTFSHIKKAGVMIEDGATLHSFVGNSFKSLGGNPVVTSGNIASSLSPVATEDIPNAVNRVHVNGANVTTGGTWKNLGIPYEIEGVNFKAEVTVEPGTTIMVMPGEIVNVQENGALIMEGTALQRISVISAKTTPKAGDWDYLGIYNTASENSKFSYVDFKHGGSTYGIVWVDEGASVSFDNCTFSDITGPGIEMEDIDLKSFTGNSFSNISGYPIIVPGNVVPSLSPITTANLAAGKDRVHVNGSNPTVGGLWKNLGIPYELEGLNFKAEVTIEAGTTLLIMPNEIIDVSDNGALILDGTADKRITVKSSKTSPAAGDWNYIGIYNTSSSSNRFSYVDIMHGGSGGYGQVWLDGGATLTLEHTIFSEGQTCDIDTDTDAILDVTDSTYTVCPD